MLLLNNLHLCSHAKICAPHLDIKDALNQGQTREFKGPFFFSFCFNLTCEQSLLFNDATYLEPSCPWFQWSCIDYKMRKTSTTEQYGAIESVWETHFWHQRAYNGIKYQKASCIVLLIAVVLSVVVHIVKQFFSWAAVMCVTDETCRNAEWTRVNF